MRWLWRQFPIFYTLPFVAATLAIDPISEAGDVARWVMLAIGSAVVFLFALYGGTRRADKLTTGDIPFILFLLFFLASTIWSIAPLYTFERAVSVVLLYLTSFWTLRIWANHFSDDLLVEKILHTLAVCLAINLGLGLVFDRAGLVTARFQGVFTNPNNIGDITAICAPLAFGKLVVQRRWRDWAVLAIIGASMTACGNRTALLTTLLAGALMITFGVIRRRQIAIIMSGAMVVFLAVFSQTTYFKENVLRADTLENMSSRTRFWDLAKEQYIPQHPGLGHGFGTDALINKYYGNDLEELQLRGYGVSSSYYGLAVQVGIPATVIFFGLLWGVAGLGLARFPNDWRVVMYGATVVAGLMVSITESIIYSAGNSAAFLFWAVVMLFLRRTRNNRLALAVNRAQRKAAKRAKRRNAGWQTPAAEPSKSEERVFPAPEVPNANPSMHRQS